MISVAQQSRISRLAKLRDIEREWFTDHGGSLAGYVKRYGSRADADHYGDGGEAIYAADHAAYARAQAKLDEAIRRAKP